VIARGPLEIPLWSFAIALIVVGTALTAPVSYRLARAHWTRRGPRPALVLWQAVCLAAGFSVVAGLVLLAVEPLGTSILGAAWNWFGALLTGRLNIPAWRWACGLAAAAITTVLLIVLGRTAALTVRRRRAHRQVLDLLTRPGSQTTRRVPGLSRMATAPDVRILDHRAAVAYTIPGWHSRVVLSAGLVDLLTDDEVAAVIEHERAHLRARHDLLVLPFQAWAVALGRIPGVRLAGGSVAELTEMLADDVAAARTSRTALASALAKVALAGAPPPVALNRLADSPAIAGTAVADRVRRLLNPRPLTRWEVVGVGLLSISLLAIPASVLLLSWT
jgi:Zn-dependent protease with chaperone function